jgi:SNF2 family DNA or RNA helicase
MRGGAILAPVTPTTTTTTTQENPVSTDIFASILNPTAPTAPTVFDGERTSPSEGFALTVAPATKGLYAYQLAAVETCLSQGRVLLGLEPGLGKTAIIQAVAAHHAAQGKRTLIVVPPSLRISPWASEFAQDYPSLRVAVVEGQKAAPLPDAEVVIVGDSIVSHRLADILAWAPDALAVDEAHRLKSRTSKRSKAVAAIADSLPVDASVILATGTLVANRVGDVWQPLAITGRRNATAVSGSPSWTAFAQRWCETQMVWTGRAQVLTVLGCLDPEGLRRRLVETCMVSVPRDEVLDLPPRTTAVRALAVNGDATRYRRIERDFLAWVREHRGDDAAKRAEKAEAITKLMALWQEDGLAKVKASAEYIGSLVEQDEQVVVMAHHTAVIEALWTRLTEAGHRVATIVGGMTAAEKADTVERFQAGEIDVLVGQITAAGTGLTLTAARHLVFVQTPWSPGDLTQASDRIYRIGQERHVTTHVLTGLGMVSESLWGVLQGKAEDADRINAGRASAWTGDSVLDEVLTGYGW